MGGELQLVKPYAIEIETLFTLDSKNPAVGLNTSKIDSAGRVTASADI